MFVNEGKKKGYHDFSMLANKKKIKPAIKNSAQICEAGPQTLLPKLQGPTGGVNPGAIENGWAGVTFLLYFIFSFAPFISFGALMLLAQSTK